MYVLLHLLLSFNRCFLFLLCMPFLLFNILKSFFFLEICSEISPEFFSYLMYFILLCCALLTKYWSKLVKQLVKVGSDWSTFIKRCFWSRLLSPPPQETAPLSIFPRGGHSHKLGYAFARTARVWF